MSAALMIEEESGTTTGTRHPHNGYYAGDFSGGPFHGVTRSSAVLAAGEGTDPLTTAARWR